MNKHQENLQKANQTQIKKEQLDKETVVKAKNHTDRVLGVIQSKKEREAQQQKVKEQEFAQKLKNAQDRKETLTKKKVEAAQMSQKRSPSKDIKEEWSFFPEIRSNIPINWCQMDVYPLKALTFTTDDDFFSIFWFSDIRIITFE